MSAVIWPEVPKDTSDGILLPTSDDALDEFVATVTAMFHLPEGDDTYDMVATMIMHLPSTKAYAPYSYFGHGVLKALANRAAYAKLQEFRKKRDEEEKAKETAKLSIVPSEETNTDDSNSGAQSV